MDDFDSEDLKIRDWYQGGQATIDEKFGQGHTVQENTVLHTQDDDSQVIEYMNKGAFVMSQPLPPIF